MELAEQYWNLKGEVRQLVKAIDTEAVYENIDAENLEDDKLGRECPHKLKEVWK